MSLVKFLEGAREWAVKIDAIAALDLPLEDFYTHLRKETLELEEGKNPEEMIDVLNCIGMLYAAGKFNVTLAECYQKLLSRERKYEQERQHP